jgi:hypothetical protein
MASRSLKQGETVAALVAKKALAALREYQSELARQRSEAAVLAEQIASRDPDATELARALYEACDFGALRRLARRRRPAATRALTALRQRLDEPENSIAERGSPGAIGATLLDREAEALQSMRSAAAGTDAPPAPMLRELKARSHFRDALQQQRADKLVTRLVTEAPADCGPLNPQSLAIRSLAAMRELSPAYLGRFVSCVDTLFWLEKTGEKTRS